MREDDHDQYVVLECLDDVPQCPRYAFATTKHADELVTSVRWLRRCGSLEAAAAMANELNARAAQNPTRPPTPAV